MADLEERTKHDVVDQLGWDGRVDAAHVLVEVNDGVVTLTGTVTTFEARRAAEQAAWMADGVVSVDNRLHVHDGAEGEDEGDAEIERDILAALRDAELKASRVRVTAREGFVSLEGAVDAPWKKDIAGEIATRRHGVLGVRNLVSVVPEGRRADEAAATAVRAALEEALGAEADLVEIEVKAGVVTLTGAVLSLKAEQAAFMAAAGASGVSDVRSELVIEQRSSLVR